MADGSNSQTQVQDRDHQSRHQADYDFFRGFFQREAIATQQVRGLQEHVSQLSAAMQHAGRESSKDRQALNKAQGQKAGLEKHLKELEEGFRQSEAARARAENELHDERQEHSLCLENLKYECNRHSETERNLERIWTSQNHLGQIMAEINCKADNGLQDVKYNVTDLVLELAEKSQKIEDLENKAQQDSHQCHTEIDQLKEHLRDESAAHTTEFMAQEERIRELGLLLQREQTSPNVESDPKQGLRRRRRHRGKWRGSQAASSKDSTTNQSDTGHVETQGYVNLPYSQSFGGLPAPQSYESQEEVHGPIIQSGVWGQDWQARSDHCRDFDTALHCSGGLATVEEESM